MHRLAEHLLPDGHANRVFLAHRRAYKRRDDVARRSGIASERSAWAHLFDLALPPLDHVFPDHDADVRAGVPRWTLGGGTAIALRIGHRASDDIDVFVPATPLKAFTPAANPAAAGISKFPVSRPPSQFERRRRDRLPGSTSANDGFSIETYKGRAIALETLEQVIVKRIRYRAARFTPKNVFDLACVAQTVPDLAILLRNEVGDAAPATGRRSPGAGRHDLRPSSLRESSAGHGLKDGAL